jgi:hypothetical protein
LLLPVFAGLAAFALKSTLSEIQTRPLTPGAPVLEAPAVLELGERDHGELVVSRFRVANRGGAELIIDRVRSSCVCSGLEREVDGRWVGVETLRIEPGVEMELAIRISLRGRIGEPIRVSVGFQTNDPERPEANIIVHVSRLKGGVYTRPGGVSFGQVLLGRPATEILEVWDSARQPRVLRAATSSRPDRISVRILDDGPVRQSEAGSCIARIEVQANTALPGPLDASVILHTDDPNRAPDEVTVTGRVADLATVTPSLVVMPRASATGSVYSANCLVQSMTGRPMVVSVDEVSPGFTATVEPSSTSPNSVLVRVECISPKSAAESPSGRHRVRLSVRIGTDVVPLEIQVHLEPSK